MIREEIAAAPTTSQPSGSRASPAPEPLRQVFSSIYFLTINSCPGDVMEERMCGACKIPIIWVYPPEDSIT